MVGRVFVFGDTHFSHHNIIGFCGRPFASVGIMNRTLFENWNEVVGYCDVVYFLGDLCKGYSDYWKKVLKGKVVFIKGNHDSFQALDRLVIEHEGIRFLLVHDPDGVVFDGWIIHAHKHNNDLVNFPFFNPGKRLVNVSADVVAFKPVLLSDIVKMIKEWEYVNSRKKD